LLRKAIQHIVGDRVVLVDSAKEVAKEARDILDSSGLLNRRAAGGRHCFYVSDEPARFVRMAEHFLKRRINCARRAV
jgi:glutamate racemase